MRPRERRMIRERVERRNCGESGEFRAWEASGWKEALDRRLLPPSGGGFDFGSESEDDIFAERLPNHLNADRETFGFCGAGANNRSGPAGQIIDARVSGFTWDGLCKCRGRERVHWADDGVVVAESRQQTAAQRVLLFH